MLSILFITACNKKEDIQIDLVNDDGLLKYNELEKVNLGDDKTERNMRILDLPINIKEGETTGIGDINITTPDYATSYSNTRMPWKLEKNQKISMEFELRYRESEQGYEIGYIHNSEYKCISVEEMKKDTTNPTFTFETPEKGDCVFLIICNSASPIQVNSINFTK